MIDIRVSAEEKKAEQELRKKVMEAYNKDVFIEVLGARVLLLSVLEEEKESLLILDEKIKQDLKGNGLMRAIVKGIGTLSIPLQTEDIVYVYPSQFEATLAIDGVGYLIYPERNIIAKDDKAAILRDSLIPGQA